MGERLGAPGLTCDMTRAPARASGLSVQPRSRHSVAGPSSPSTGQHFTRRSGRLRGEQRGNAKLVVGLGGRAGPETSSTSAGGSRKHHTWYGRSQVILRRNARAGRVAIVKNAYEEAAHRAIMRRSSKKIRHCWRGQKSLARLPPRTRLRPI